MTPEASARAERSEVGYHEASDLGDSFSDKVTGLFVAEATR